MNSMKQIKAQEEVRAQREAEERRERLERETAADMLVLHALLEACLLYTSLPSPPDTG